MTLTITSIETIQETVKEFINANKREEIIFTSGATDSINMAIYGYFMNNLKKGDEGYTDVDYYFYDHTNNLLVDKMSINNYKILID